MNLKVNDDTPELISFVKRCQALRDDLCDHYKGLDFKVNKKYVKIYSCDPEGKPISLYCFIDRSNGDIFKGAGWSKPAKHSRGNIFEADNGMARMSWVGPHYLR